MQVEALYEDDKFNDLLVNYANRRSIYEFDDYKQDVFLAILEEGAGTRKECQRIADKVAKRYSRTDTGADIESMAYTDDEGNTETHEETMSRLIHEGRAVKIS